MEIQPEIPVLGTDSALHTLLSLYKCASSITTPVRDGLLVFILEIL
jgi:hypothetical protein